MAEKEGRLSFIPWLPLITLIMVSGGVLLSFQQLNSSRPGGGNTRLAVDTFDDQTVDARLWQDPLGVAVADREKTQRDSAAHSITQFQNLLIKKCFAEPIYASEKKLDFEKQLEVLAVMIPRGPYVEDVERRLRSRRAVIEALETADYGPEKDHEIAYFYVSWQHLDPNIAACVSTLQKNRDEDEGRWFPTNSGIQPARSNWKESDEQNLIVPYEWYEPTTFGQRRESEHILVLWLVDDAFRDAPLARLADLISWFRFKLVNDLRYVKSSPFPVFTPVFKVLGPENSGTLHKMVIEANVAPWDDYTRQCLVAAHIYSSQAAVAET